MLHGQNMKIMLIKVSNTSLMLNKIMDKTGLFSMGSATIHPGFHIDGIPKLGKHGNSIGQAQKI